MEEKINVVELFGSNVFNDKVMQERLPKKVYRELHKTIDEGKELDPDEYLSRYSNWKDVSSLPYKFAEEPANDEKSKKVEDPTAKGGIVGAYCRAYSIFDVLCELSDVYEEGSLPGRYTYKNGTSSNGVQVIDGKFVYSFHATDPASGKLLNAFDLMRVHRFNDADEKKSFKKMA